MTKEPMPDKSASDVRNFFAGKQTEQDLADAFAIASNKFWWVEDNVYDYAEGTPEYIAARTVTDEWEALMGEYEEKIYEILRNEGITIPQTARIKVLRPFMKRNGYIDGSGWWIKDKESK